MPLNAPSMLAEAACCQDETWEVIPGWPHEASTCGRIRRLPWLDSSGCLHLGGEVACCPDKRKGKGYLYATLRDGTRQRRAHVAVLVLEAHRGPRPGQGWEASHLYGIRTDNHLDGLAWETRAQNLARISQHALERAVTTQGPVTAGLSQTAGHRGARDHAALSLTSVTSERKNSTGRSPSFLTFPSSFPSVKPALRAVRNRLAA